MPTTAHGRWLAGACLVCWSGSWGAEALTGVQQAGLPLLVAGVLAWRRTWHPWAVRATREATTEALRQGRDPGEEFRVATAEHARQVLARSTALVHRLAATLVALAVACAVAGWAREDSWDAAPALPLLVVAAGSLVVDRQARAHARRWLERHPVDHLA